MEPDAKDQDFKQFQLDSAAQQFEDDGENGEYFPILALPTELISHIFSFLSMEDRLRARVNKRLDTIELEAKYYVEVLIIQEVYIKRESEEETIEEEEEEDEYERYCVTPVFEEEEGDDESNEDEEDEEGEIELGDYQRITFYKEKSYSSDCIRRISQNTTIGMLVFSLNASNEFNREIFNLVKDFDIGFLIFDEGSIIVKELMVDSFLLDLTEQCKRLEMCVSEKVTPEALQQVYKIVQDGSAKIREFHAHISKEQSVAVLQLQGITYRDGRLFSNRKIEVYARQEDEDDEEKKVDYYVVFDGHLEFALLHSIIDDAITKGVFVLVHHETQESLEKRKNRVVVELGFKRVEIGPE